MMYQAIINEKMLDEQSGKYHFVFNGQTMTTESQLFRFEFDGDLYSAYAVFSPGEISKLEPVRTIRAVRQGAQLSYNLLLDSAFPISEDILEMINQTAALLEKEAAQHNFTSSNIK